MKYKIKNEPKKNRQEFTLSCELDNNENYFNLYGYDKKGGKYLLFQFDTIGQGSLYCVNACVHTKINESGNLELITINSQ